MSAKHPRRPDGPKGPKKPTARESQDAFLAETASVHRLFAALPISRARRDYLTERVAKFSSEQNQRIAACRSDEEKLDLVEKARLYLREQTIEAVSECKGRLYDRYDALHASTSKDVRNSLPLVGNRFSGGSVSIGLALQTPLAEALDHLHHAAAEFAAMDANLHMLENDVHSREEVLRERGRNYHIGVKSGVVSGIGVAIIIWAWNFGMTIVPSIAGVPNHAWGTVQPSGPTTVPVTAPVDPNIQSVGFSGRESPGNNPHSGPRPRAPRAPRVHSSDSKNEGRQSPQPPSQSAPPVDPRLFQARFGKKSARTG